MASAVKIWWHPARPRVERRTLEQSILLLLQPPYLGLSLRKLLASTLETFELQEPRWRPRYPESQDAATDRRIQSFSYTWLTWDRSNSLLLCRIVAAAITGNPHKCTVQSSIYARRLRWDVTSVEEITRSSCLPLYISLSFSHVRPYPPSASMWCRGSMRAEGIIFLAPRSACCGSTLRAPRLTRYDERVAFRSIEVVAETITAHHALCAIPVLNRLNWYLARTALHGGMAQKYDDNRRARMRGPGEVTVIVTTMHRPKCTCTSPDWHVHDAPMRVWIKLTSIPRIRLIAGRHDLHSDSSIEDPIPPNPNHNNGTPSRPEGDSAPKCTIHISSHGHRFGPITPPTTLPNEVSTKVLQHNIRALPNPPKNVRAQQTGLHKSLGL
ncbi:hypothetical protein C8R44DRAFT_752341 [Mycena epipterygia]|nr:hypothetical protein C8R44DRAFT_752341 [Mycena epipterygia]